MLRQKMACIFNYGNLGCLNITVFKNYWNVSTPIDTYGTLRRLNIPIFCNKVQFRTSQVYAITFSCSRLPLFCAFNLIMDRNKPYLNVNFLLYNRVSLKYINKKAMVSEIKLRKCPKIACNIFQ